MSAKVAKGTSKVTDVNPLTATPPLEVPLKNAPLVRAIAQVRFPPILSIETTKYTSRSDFLARLEDLLVKLHSKSGF